MSSKPFQLRNMRMILGKSEVLAEPPLTLGNVVRLNSGSPQAVVVDCAGDRITFAWRDGAGVHEHTLPARCVYRVPLGSEA